MSLSRIASFDIGRKNFAFCVEEFDSKQLQLISRPGLRYDKNGILSSEYQNSLDSVYRNGTVILFKNSDITPGHVDGSYTNSDLFQNMYDLLDEHIEEWDKCSTFIIEQQMSFGKAVNTLALKLGQHCYSYFVFKYGRFKTIVEWPAYHKTQVLGAEKTMKRTKKGKIRWIALGKTARKKWAVFQAMKILTLRNDKQTLELLNSVRKRDDLADTLCQLQSYKYLIYV